MKRSTARKILNLNNTEKYFIDEGRSLLKVESDNTMAFVRFFNGDKWEMPDDERDMTFHFSRMIFENTKQLKRISKAEVFEIML